MKVLVSKIDFMAQDDLGKQIRMDRDKAYVVSDLYVEFMKRDLGRDSIKSATEFEPAHFYNGEDLNGKSLLVFRHGGIGALLFLTANLVRLKEKYPDAKIKLVTNGQYISLIRS